jgi:hypothetical protein
MCLARDVKGGMIYVIVFLTALSWIISRGINHGLSIHAR